jgi:hypothetical protein
MNIADYKFLAKDRLLAERFDSRVRTAMRLLIPVHAVIIFLNAVIDGVWDAALAHMGMAAIAWFIVSRSSDGIRTFIFTNVYWMFSFTTYFYALTHGQTASYGLGSPDRSALIALVSQAGLLCAFFLTPRQDVMKASQGENYAKRMAVFRGAQYPLALLGIIGLFGESLGLPSIYSATLISILYVALSIRLTSGRFLKDPALWAMFISLLIVSASGNSRSALMALIFMMGFALLIFKKNLFSPLLLFSLYLGARLLGVFSDVMLSIRWARDTSVSMFGLFLENFFSLETLLAIINPLYTSAAAKALAESPSSEGGFYTAFFSGSGGLMTRLTLLPQMDIVVSKIPDDAPVRWADLWGNLFWNVIPSIGQQKDLILSDQIVWELGLRAWYNIGRPMITVQGELYSIGGYATVFFVTIFLYYMMSYFYGAISRLLGSRVSGIMIMSQMMIGTVMTTTLLSVAVVTTRGSLQLVLILSGIIFVFSRVMSRPDLAKRGQSI